jgi:iron complex outermembrane recepter protein
MSVLDRSAILGLSAILLAVGVDVPAYAQTHEARAFDIKPQALDSALIELALQAGISISLPLDGLGDARSVALNGPYTPEAALGILLKGSGYTFANAGAHSYAIVPLKVDQRASSQPAKAPASAVVIVSARIPTTEAALPRDVTRLDAATMDGVPGHSDSDLAGLVGGLSFTNLGAGRNKVMLRGLSDGALSGRTQSLVGLYFDDTRITYSAPDPDLQLVDIASIEVLRGPQGALYGAGSIGGIMRLESNVADLTRFGGSVLVSTESIDGGDQGDNIELVLNAPLVKDTVGLRAVFYNERDGGWLDDKATGARDTNSASRKGARLSLLSRFSSGWTLNVAGLTQEISTRDSQYLTITSGGLSRSAAMPEPHDNDFGMLNATLKGRTSWGDLTSSTSILRHQFDSRFDATGNFPDIGAMPDAIRPIDEEDALHILVHETRLSSPLGARIPWFLGAFVADGDTQRNVVLREGAPGVWDSTAYHEQRIDNIDELAVFGETTFRLHRNLTLSTGLRFFRSTLKMSSVIEEPSSASEQRTTGRLTSSGVAPDIRLLYRPGADLLFYVSAAKGYRPPGFNTVGPVDQQLSTTTQPLRRYNEDHIWTYEAGARIRLLDDRLNLRATGFDSDWHNVQTDELISNGFGYSGNVGDAHATGLDLEASYEPAPGLTLKAQAMISESEIKHPNPTYPLATDGNLPGSPEISGGASARYERLVPLAGRSALGFLELGGRYVGRSNLGFGAGGYVGNYFVADVRAGMQIDAWQAMAYVDNIGNSDGSTYSFGNPYQLGQELITPLRPRAVGVVLKRSF